MHPKHPETCRHCGARIHFIVAAEGPVSEKRTWLVVNTDWTKHRCAKADVKIYTEEEKREFEIKRQGGTKA